MAQVLDRCDIIDRLEEAVKTGRAVAVETAAGDSFVDRVRSVETKGGEDFARFLDHGRMPVSDISNCSRVAGIENSYDAKL